MEGIITNFRRGKHTKSDNQMIIKINEVTNKEQTSSVLGKKVVWESPAGKKINGKISIAHGNNGCVRAIFEKGMPGQAIATKVRIE